METNPLPPALQTRPGLRHPPRDPPSYFSPRTSPRPSETRPLCRSCFLVIRLTEGRTRFLFVSVPLFTLPTNSQGSLNPHPPASRGPPPNPPSSSRRSTRLSNLKQEGTDHRTTVRDPSSLPETEGTRTQTAVPTWVNWSVTRSPWVTSINKQKKTRRTGRTSG